jgi:uncharacterized peroxidase-related enzyme
MTTTSTSPIPIATKENAPAESKPILENYEKVLGATPNFFSLISLSPDTLKAIANMHATLGKSLGHKTRERIHIATTEVNGCDYCVSAHTYVGGKFTGLTKEDMDLNREGHSTDTKADAAAQFAYKVAKARGHISDADFEPVRAAGYSALERKSREQLTSLPARKTPLIYYNKSNIHVYWKSGGDLW